MGTDIVLLGWTNVGKTSLFRRIEDGCFAGEASNIDGLRPTVGWRHQTLRLQVDDQVLQAQVWDTGGQHQLMGMPMPRSHSRKVAMFCVMYDITSRLSFQKVRARAHADNGPIGHCTAAPLAGRRRLPASLLNTPTARRRRRT